MFSLSTEDITPGLRCLLTIEIDILSVIYLLFIYYEIVLEVHKR
jgi:hypothetical protein